MATEKRERKMTPIGEARWAHLHTPKAPYKDDHGSAKGEPKYQIDVLFDKSDVDWAAWAGKVMNRLKSMPEQVDKKTGVAIPKQVPIKRELDESEQPTGRFYITFKTSDRFKPDVFDAHGRPIPETTLIGNGSKVSVSYIENEYTAFGGGINFYLNAVQVVTLVEYKPKTAEAYGFPVEPVDESALPDTDIPF